MISICPGGVKNPIFFTTAQPFLGPPLLNFYARVSSRPSTSTTSLKPWQGCHNPRLRCLSNLNHLLNLSRCFHRQPRQSRLDLQRDHRSRRRNKHCLNLLRPRLFNHLRRSLHRLPLPRRRHLLRCMHRLHRRSSRLHQHRPCLHRYRPHRFLHPFCHRTWTKTHFGTISTDQACTPPAEGSCTARLKRSSSFFKS